MAIAPFIAAIVATIIATVIAAVIAPMIATTIATTIATIIAPMIATISVNSHCNDHCDNHCHVNAAVSHVNDCCNSHCNDHCNNHRNHPLCDPNLQCAPAVLHCHTDPKRTQAKQPGPLHSTPARPQACTNPSPAPASDPPPGDATLYCSLVLLQLPGVYGSWGEGVVRSRLHGGLGHDCGAHWGDKRAAEKGDGRQLAGGEL